MTPPIAPTPPIVLIDGSSYFYRAFHALPPLTTSKGQATGAVYGVINMIKRLIKDYQPKHIAVIFDAKGKTFRDEWYPAYKANRESMPEALRGQFQPMIDFLKAMGLPLLIVEGVEADDVIGTLAKEATAKGQKILISTGDKDMAQLVNEHVTLINTMSNQILDIQGVKDKFGVAPTQIIDYLTLTGDTSDNIKGVNKCGAKTAAKWLSRYETLDNLLANITEITGKIGESLQQSLAHLPLSKRLLTIKTDVALPMQIEDLEPSSPDTETLIAMSKELEFKTWLKELLGQAQANTSANPEATGPSSHSYELISTEEALSAWLKKLSEAKLFCLYTKTNALDILGGDIVGLAFAFENATPTYIPLMQEAGSSLSRERILAALAPILENENIAKIGHNLKFDYNIFKKYGITLKGIASNTMLTSYVLDSAASRHDLESLSLKYLGHKTISFEDIAGKGVRQLGFAEIPIEKAAAYASEMADTILKLHQALSPKLTPELKTVLEEIEVPLATVLANMERTGVLIDKQALSKLGEELSERLRVLEKDIFQLSGRSFNINSPKQLQEILFDELKLPIISKTPTGQPSTAEAVLQELALDYELPKKILEYRSLSKLLSTYIEALPRWENPLSGRVHTSYNQAVTTTGRLSSTEPNLQNIPIRSHEGRLIRTAFIAPADYVILAADYSQIELRIMAHLSQDPGLLEAFAKHLDIHTATAAEIFNVPLNEVSQEHRRRAKAVNFGLIYGMSSYGLGRQLGIDKATAQQYIDRYFSRYPKVLEYMENTRALAHKQGYVETIFGRRLHMPEIHTRNLMRQRAAERAAINAPMQGSAADIIKRAMLAIDKWTSTANPKPRVQMIMQVHDELVFEVHKDEVEDAKAMIRRLMEESSKLSVPLEVSIGVGMNWDEAH